MKTIFEMPESIWKDAYLNVVTFYRQYPIEYHSIDECIDNHSLYSEEHHITPLWFYKQAKAKPDNSKSNLVRLPYYWHIMAHVYLCRYFKAIKDSSNLIKAVNAIWCFFGRANHHVRKCIDLPTFTKSQIEELERLKIEALHGKHDKKYTYEQMIQFRDDYNRFGFEYVRDHDGFNGKNQYALIRQFKNWNLSFTKKKECHQWTRKEVDDLWNLCHDFGFQYVFANNLVPAKMSSHKQLNKVFWRYGKPQLPSGLPKKKPVRRKNLVYHNTGKIVVNNGVTQRFVDPGSIPLGWKVGRLPLASGKGTKGKVWISNKLTNEVQVVSPNTPLPSADWEYGNHQQKGTIRITNGIQDKMISKDQPIPSGWKRGTLYAGCKWMNNGIREETVLEPEQADRLQNGWKFGRLWSPKKSK